jgi:hypothetical protein
MGYTHYWTQRRDFTKDEWTTVSADFAALFKHAIHAEGIYLADGMGDRGTKPEIDGDRILFNGVGDDSHETFTVNRKRPPKAAWEKRRGWDFCKTARKPYDAVVVAALCYLATILETHDVSTDGSGPEFLDGLALARRAWPQYANQLDIPLSVMAEDRWCGPWVQRTDRSKYEIRFCVDGFAYVMRGNRSIYRFDSHEEAACWLAPNDRETWNATGSFDKARWDRIARRQNELVEQLLWTKTDNRRDEQPPAFVRPGQMPPAPSYYYVADVLNAAALAV